MNQNFELYYHLLNGFLSAEAVPEEVSSIPDLFAPHGACAADLEQIYQARQQLLLSGASEELLNLIFDGFEKLMHEVGYHLYLLGKLETH